MQSKDFYQSHLDRVSRSFAFCIARLDGDLRIQISLSYLLLRLLDSIEDAIWESPQSQGESFEIFNRFMQESPQESLWQNWVQRVPNTLPLVERDLLVDSLSLFRELHQLPPNVKRIIQDSVLNMSRGMMFFLERRGSKKGLHLDNLDEVNGYCFFVAGIVGELLTDLVALTSQRLMTSPKIYVQAIHFGLFLQKINILKDQLADEKEGRQLVPSRSELIASLRLNAQGAVEYLVAIPLEEKGYRLFCAWSLFLGLASISWIQKSWILRILEKIPRSITMKLLANVEVIIDDNVALLKQFQEFVQTLPTLEKNISADQVPWISYEKFQELYSGRLSFEELSEIGLFAPS
ncbi:MAG TPA: squalene/phytoene synthase family protein [Pseudobdellovibrionaceae bacterium]|jgi:phytoene/squalene synthetase